MKQFYAKLVNSIEPTLLKILGIREYKNEMYILLQEDKSVNNSIILYKVHLDESGEYLLLEEVYSEEVYDHFSGLLNSMVLREKNQNP